jgi:hypothetical protein
MAGPDYDERHAVGFEETASLDEQLRDTETGGEVFAAGLEDVIDMASSMANRASYVAASLCHQNPFLNNDKNKIEIRQPIQEKWSPSPQAGPARGGLVCPASSRDEDWPCGNGVAHCLGGGMAGSTERLGRGWAVRRGPIFPERCRPACASAALYVARRPGHGARSQGTLCLSGGPHGIRR